MTLPVVKWADPLLCEIAPEGLGNSYLPHLYYTVVWGAHTDAISAWHDTTPFNPDFNCTQTGRGTGADRGYAIYSEDRTLNLGIPVANFGFTPSATMGMAFAFDRGGLTRRSVIACFGTDDGKYVHVQLVLDTAGHVVAYRCGGGLDLSGPDFDGVTPTQIGISDGTGASGSGTTSFLMPLTGYIHFEVIVTVSGGAGVVKVWADEILILNLTGVNTNGGGAAIIGIAGWATGGNARMTDLVLHDGTGNVGDVRAEYFGTIADGSYTAGVAVGSGTKHGAVDEIVSNGDTDYVNIDDVGLPKAQSFLPRQLPPTVKTVIAVSPWVIASKDNSGADKIRPILVSGGTTADDGTDRALRSVYAPVYSTPFMLDPNGSVAWTTANVNALECGAKRVA
jgi:hypothetical protein